MRKSGVSKYVRVVQDMYEEAWQQCKRRNKGVSCGSGSASGIRPGPHHVFMVTERLTDEIRLRSPWTMMFADDTVICSEMRVGRK